MFWWLVLGRAALADEFSNIEMDVYWDSAPNGTDHHAPLEANDWTLVSAQADENEWANSFLIGGITVDTSQFLVSTLDDWTNKVMMTGDIEPEYQMRITAIRHGIPPRPIQEDFGTTVCRLAFAGPIQTPARVKRGSPETAITEVLPVAAASRRLLQKCHSGRTAPPTETAT